VKYSIVSIACSTLVTICLYLVIAAYTITPCNGQELNIDTFSNSISSHEITDLFFLDATHGWMAVADHNLNQNYILQSKNRGASWRRFNCPLGVKKLFFVSPDQGWALQWVVDATLHRTSIHLLGTRDGGQHWTELAQSPVVDSTEQTNEYVTAMAFMDKFNGWIVGAGPDQTGLILQTNDGGKTLQRINRPLSNCFGVAAHPNAGVLVFGVGYLIRSIDKGKHWESPVDLGKLGVKPIGFLMSSAKFMHDGRGWLAGQAGRGAILTTQDFGQSWQKQFEDSGDTIFQDIWPIDAGHLCAVGNSTFLFCSTDGGSTWSSADVLPRLATTQSPIFKKIVLLPSGRGWVVRYGGYLYRTSDEGRTWQEFDPLSN
jgi:photosystem II stability/assembly factor-like uncharacterized protein